MEHPQIHGLSEWKPLARGGFAVVWEARQLSLNRMVAVKVYQRELDDTYRRRFLREAAAARLSEHPGIVTVHDAGLLPDDRPYLVMDLWSGGSLNQWLKPDNRPSQERVRQVGVRIADALAAVHACGVLHRDVKPANILIDSFGNPGLADFGLAAMAGAETTAADVLYVTPAYAPPEAFGMQPATRYGDVFSLAATLYALLAGRPPRDVRGPYVALEEMVEVAKRPIGPVPGVDCHLMNVLMTALSNDPAARPTAETFRDQLANVPAPRILQGGALVGAAEDAFSVSSSHRRSIASGHPPISDSQGIALAAVTADSNPAPGQVTSVAAPRRLGTLRRGIPVLAAALVTLIAPATAWLISEPTPSAVPTAVTQSPASSQSSSSAGRSPASDPRPPTSSAAPDAGDSAGSGSAEMETIQLEESADAAKPFEIVQIRGTHLGGADTFLRVERWEGGEWVPFPLPAKTDQSGQFIAYVELGQPGRYRLRVLDPDSGVTSKPSAVVVKG